MSIETLLETYLDECTRQGMQAEVRAVVDRREELVVRNGTVESDGVTDDTVLSLTVGDGDSRVVLASGVDVDPAGVVDEGVVILRAMSAFEGTARVGVAAAAESTQTAGRSATSLADVRDELIDRSRLAEARECELRSTQTTRSVHFASLTTRLTYTTSSASILFRATRSAEDGEIVHVDCSDSGPSVRTLLDDFDSRILNNGLQQLTAPALAAARALPARVVLDGRVAAALIWMFAESLSAEAVEQGWSLFKRRLGETVASELVSFVDDPTLAGGPRCFPFDDEAVPACRRTLIDRGMLASFLGSRAFAKTIEGSAPGNARQPDATSAPRPAPSNFFVKPADSPLPLDAPTLRIVQTHGIRLANNITGEFSTGATALVEDGDEVRRVTGLSMAGNIIDLFRGVEGLGAELQWSPPDEVEASFGSPDLLVRGLTIGR
jgi:predicted Zn-dependent protease